MKLNYRFRKLDYLLLNLYFMKEKYPDVKLITAEGKSGEGKGSIEIKGIKKDIKGTYKVDGTNLIADFDLNIKDFKIENVRYMGVGVKDIVHVTAKIPIK